uniref:Replicase n=1 Tax=Lepidopteran rhabdo-related virus OKIAV32 TaxID=2746299 RepID=A0A7D7F852_9RHAB|nr:RNA-dependent RNA polymerase [Lepidopteran rhabdo-related virus OKIAV32]
MKMDTDEDYIRVKAKPPLPAHCDAPLTFINVRKALLRPAPGQYINKRNPCRREWIQMKENLEDDTIIWHDPSHVQNTLLNHFNPTPSPVDQLERLQALNVAHQVYDLQVRSILTSMGLKHLPLDVSPLRNNHILARLYQVRCFFEEAVALTSNKNHPSGSWWKRDNSIIQYQYGDLRMMAGDNLWYINFAGKTILTSRDHLTLYADLAAQRYNLILHAEIMKQTTMDTTPTTDHLLALFRVGDEILERAGNIAYKLIYTLEESCVSRAIGNYEGGHWTQSRFRQAICKDMIGLARDYQVYDLYNQREELLDKLWERNPSQLIQCYGLYRIWGHPTLEPLLGVNALKHKGLRARWYNGTAALEINNTFKEDFITKFINRHKEWPALDVSLLSPYNPIRVHYERKLQFPIHDRYYKRDHLSMVKFKAIFPIDPKFDLIEFIDDKSISLAFPDLIEEIIHNKSIGNSLARSLLLAFLKSDISDPEKFLRRIDVEGFPTGEISIGVREKEREGKLEARLFGLLTLIKRSYVVLTEKLIADNLFPYFPEITMTDDELSLETKRLNFTRLIHRVIMVSVDFRKWNTNMRHHDTLPFFDTLDDMFGFENCFKRTHEMFHGSFMYLIDGSYLPTVTPLGLEPDEGCWYGHLGGIEGLRQKGWTVWTVVLLKMAAEPFDFDLKIMGQGDNQMLSLEFPESYSSQLMIEQTNKFLDGLDNILAVIGPSLKLEETWISTDFFLYGKYPIYKGSAVCMSMKKACRMFRGCNEDYPTVESSLSSLAANLYSAVSSDHVTQPLYLLYLIEAVGLFQINIRRPYLQRSSFPELIDRKSSFNVFSNTTGSLTRKCPDILSLKSHLQSDHLYIGLLLCPRTLGGYPIVMYASLLVKGFPDQLSYDIATLTLIETYNPHLSDLVRKLKSPPLSLDLNYELLAQNPEAINIETTQAPSEARRTAMIEFLKNTHHVTQPYVVEFLSILDIPSQASLTDYLFSNHEIHPKVINIFTQATPFYRAQQVIGKLQKTPTMARVYQQEGDKDLYHILERAELNHFKSVLRIIFENRRPLSALEPYDSAVDHAQILRNIGWQKEVIGVDCAPPHEIFYLESVVPSVPCDATTELDKGYISVRLIASSSTCQNPHLIGPVFPYRGSVTKTKIESVATHIKSKCPSLLQRAIAVAELENWVFQRGGALSHLARALVAQLTDVPFDLLIPEVDQISGAYQHRLRSDRVDNGGVCAVLPSQSSKIQLDTSSLVYLNKGSKNKNFMFQSPMVMVLLLIGEGLLLNTCKFPDSALFHFHIKNSVSIKDRKEAPVEYTPPATSVTLISNPSSPYLYFPSNKITNLIKSRIRYPPTPKESRTTFPLSDRFHSLLAYECVNLLDPWAWTSGRSPKRTTMGITINWAFSTNLPLWVDLLAMLILSSFFLIERSFEPTEWISKCLAIVKSSPLDSWTNMTNICFNKDYPGGLYRHHHILGGQTSEVLTPSCVAYTIKSSVLASIVNISRSLTTLSSMQSLWAPVSVPGPLHPLRVASIWSWISKGRPVSREIIKDMQEKVMRLQGVPPHPALPIEISRGWSLSVGISPESLDYLCKCDLSCETKDLSVCRFIGVEDVSSCYWDILTLSDQDLPTGMYNQQWDHWENLSLLTSRDYESYQYRHLPLPASGCYKLLSVIEANELRSYQTYACLADGTGGFTRVCCLLPWSVTVFFNTLVNPQDLVPQMAPIQNIPDIADLPLKLTSKIVGLDITNNFPSDITSQGYALTVRRECKTSFEVVTGDAESPEYYDPLNVLKLFRSYTMFCSIMRSRVGIFKIHTRNPALLGHCITMLLSHFQNVQIRRSKYSLRSNMEVYIYCTMNPQVSSPYKPNWAKSGMDEENIASLSSILESKLIPLLSDRISIPDHIERQYTASLSPHLTNHDLFNNFKLYFPWINEDTTLPGAQRVPIQYPEDIDRWIHSTHRSSVKGAHSTTTVMRLENFKQAEINILMMSHILCVILDTEPTRWNEIIPVIIKQGYLLWYSTTQSHWHFLFSISDLPDVDHLSGTQVHPVLSTIEHIVVQKVCRMVGLLRFLGVRGVVTPKSKRAIDTFSKYKGRGFLMDPNRPVNPFVMSLLSGDRYNGRTKPWFLYPDFLIRQEKRLLGA